MKNRILSLAVACLAGIAAYAQWTAPELPTEASELVAGHKYQVRNKEIGEFLTGTQVWYSWSTSTALLPDRDNAITYVIDQTEDEYGVGWTFVNSATGNYTFVSGLMGDSFAEEYQGLGEMHIDMASQGNNHFEIEEQDASAHTYRVKGSYTTYDDYGEVESVATGYWGYIKGDEVYPTAVYGLLDPSANSDYCCDWEFLDMTTYDARLDLYDALVESQNYSGVDVSSASSVYENSNATLEEIEAATEEVMKLIAESLTAGASEDNPVDVTSLIKNADFTDGTLSPWENTTGVLVYSSDTFPNGDCNLWDVNDNETYSNAIAGWVSSSGSLGDEDVHQDIGYLPAGQYLLTCSMVAQHSTDMPSGVFIYVNDNELECKHDEAFWAQLVAAGTTNQLMMHPELIFIHEGGNMTVGLKLVDTNCNWVYASKFKLTYYGETSKSAAYLSLENAVAEAKAYLDTDEYHYRESVRAELEAAISSAESLLRSMPTDEQVMAESEALQAVVSEVRIDVSAYNNFLSYVETVQSDRDKYDAAGFDYIAGELGDLYEEVREHYNECDLSPEEIQEYIDSYNALLAELVADAMVDATVDNPIDVTMVYLQNADFSDGTLSPWENTTGVLVYSSDTFPNSDCNLWEVNNNETFNRAIAAWVSSSGSLGDEDVHQTISNLPKGSYIFSCSMVAQHGTDMPEGVYLYSNGFVETSTEVKHDDALWSQLVEAGTTNQLMEHPQHVFYHMGGDATVGLRLVNTNCNWVYASKFTLSYAGVSMSAMYEAMMEMAQQAEALTDEAQYVKKADDLLQEAIGAAEDCPTDDEDAILAVMEQLQEAISYANESIELMTTLEYNYVIYSDYLIPEVESDEATFPQLLEDIASCIEDGYESKEQIEDFITDLQAGFTTYVEYPVLDATEEKPGDITAALLNANFEGLFGGSENGFWDLEVSGGTNGAGYNAYECYNNTSFRVSQTVLGLAEGYYRIRVQGFYRPGSHAANVDSLAVDPDYGQNVTFFANAMTTPLCNVVVGGSTEALGIDGETSVVYNDETIYLPNSMYSSSEYFNLGRYWNQIDVPVKDGALEIGLYKDVNISSDWTIWNGFELYYLGAEAPTAVGSVYDSETIGVGEVASTQYFSVDGTRKARLTKGINIIKTTLADGTVQIQKVLVK